MTSSYQSIRLRFLFIPREKCILYLKINIISTWHHRVKVYDLRVYVNLIVRSQSLRVYQSRHTTWIYVVQRTIYNGVRPSMTLFVRFVVRRTPTIACNRRWCRPHDRRWSSLNDVGGDVRWDRRTCRSYTLIRWYRGLEITFFLRI